VQGDKFVILDCGGGTVDVTVHSLVTKAPFRLNELAPPSGGPWGSTYVDAAFCNVLRDMMGAASYQRLTKRMAFLELMVRWAAVQLHHGQRTTPPAHACAAASHALTTTATAAPRAG
jgi:hypothetical protein